LAEGYSGQNERRRNPRIEPKGSVLVDSSPATISAELRRFVDGEHPRARVLTIGHVTIGPHGPVALIVTRR
jgi:hypothetical protein